MKIHLRLLARLAAVLVTASWTIGSAQTTTTTTTTTNATGVSSSPTGAKTPDSTTLPDEKDDVVKLSKFDVKDTKDSGYFPRESVSGMKTKESLMDTPGNLQVVPRDLIDDIGAGESTAETLKFVVSGVNQYVRGETLQIRGSREGELVDDIPDWMFFADNVGIDSYEVLKGPTAVLYGRYAGLFGLVIKTQKKPLPVFGGYISQTLGDGNYRRTELDVSGPLTKGFSYRIVGAYQYYPNKNDAYMDDRKVLITMLQWTNGKTTVRAAYENANITRGLGNGINMVNYENGPEITPYTSPFGKFFHYAPKLGYNADYSNDVRLSLIHQFNENWQSKVFFYRSNINRPSVTYPGLSSYSIKNNTFTLYFDAYEEPLFSEVYGMDNVGKYEVFDRELQTNFGYLYNDLGTASTEIYQEKWITGSLTSPPDFSKLTAPFAQPGRSNVFDHNPVRSYYLVQSARLLPKSDRIVINGGVSRITVPPIGGNSNISETVYRAGIVVKPIKDVAVYYGYSTRFDPTNPLNRDYYGNKLTNVKGIGEEVGIKTDLFDHRLMITVDHYDLKTINRYTFGVGPSPITGQPFYVPLGNTEAKGEEIDIKLQITNNWQLVAVGWHGNDLNSNHIQLDNTVKENVAFFTKYQFNEGVVKGLSIGGGTYYVGRRLFASTSQYMDPHSVTNVFVDYKLDKHWSFGVHVDNLFDKYYIQGAWGISNIDYGDPRTIRVTTKYAF